MGNSYGALLLTPRYEIAFTHDLNTTIKAMVIKLRYFPCTVKGVFDEQLSLELLDRGIESIDRFRRLGEAVEVPRCLSRRNVRNERRVRYIWD